MINNTLLDLKREINFSGGVTQESIVKLAEEIQKINDADDDLEVNFKLRGLENKRTPIKLNINSYGGDAYAGHAGFDIISKSQTPVNTHVIGVAMSAALLLVIAGATRTANQNATIMYHEIATISWDKLEGIKRDVKECKRLQKMYDSKIIKNTNVSKKKLKELCKSKHDWFLSAKEAKKYGVIDSVV